MFGFKLCTESYLYTPSGVVHTSCKQGDHDHWQALP